MLLNTYTGDPEDVSRVGALSSSAVEQCSLPPQGDMSECLREVVNGVVQKSGRRPPAAKNDGGLGLSESTG